MLKINDNQDPKYPSELHKACDESANKWGTLEAPFHWLIYLVKTQDISLKNSDGKTPFSLFNMDRCIERIVLTCSDFGASYGSDEPQLLKELINLLLTKINDREDVPFLCQGSPILINLFREHGSNDIIVETIIDIYTKYPDLITVAYKGKLGIYHIKTEDFYTERFAFSENETYLKLNQTHQDFLNLFKENHPRLYLEFLLRDKNLLMLALGNRDQIKAFATAHDCMDLVPPTVLEWAYSIFTSFNTSYAKVNDAPSSNIVPKETVADCSKRLPPTTDKANINKNPEGFSDTILWFTRAPDAPTKPVALANAVPEENEEDDLKTPLLAGYTPC